MIVSLLVGIGIFSIKPENVQPAVESRAETKKLSTAGPVAGIKSDQKVVMVKVDKGYQNYFGDSEEDKWALESMVHKLKHDRYTDAIDLLIVEPVVAMHVVSSAYFSMPDSHHKEKVVLQQIIVDLALCSDPEQKTEAVMEAKSFFIAAVTYAEPSHVIPSRSPLISENLKLAALDRMMILETDQGKRKRLANNLLMQNRKAEMKKSIHQILQASSIFSSVRGPANE